jgi:alkanesulfonate monooxygenase SsuD/methylene tetrahydromethanopterin reductase-like flavin-dependent oxidoreductase (luciferase family)
MASAVDDLSGGRLRLGLGAGWQDREHDHFGFDLLPIPQRLARYREGVEVTVSLLRSDTPVTFEGDYYHLRDAILLPRPQRQGGPAIVIGGKRGVLALAAQYADEWNVPFVSAATFADLSRRLDQLLRERGRASDQVRRTLMTNVIFGHSRAELQAKLAARARSADDLHAAGILVGVGEEVREQLGALAAAGVQTVMLQWLDLDDLDGLARFARAVLP